jgi:hypothetical protein
MEPGTKLGGLSKSRDAQDNVNQELGMSRRRWWVGSAVIAVLAMAAAAVAAGGPAALVSRLTDLPVLIRGRLLAAPSGEELAVPIVIEQHAEELVDGFVVWSSNRDGNHELYRMDLPGRQVRRLTEHLHVDYYGRISPDGNHIVFMRSSPGRLSVREAGGWEIWVMDAEGGGARRLAEEGYRPGWSADGSAVHYMRDRSGYRVDVETGATEKLFDFPDVLPRIRYGGVYISPDASRITAAFPGGVTRIFELPGFQEHVLDNHQSCQGLWAPGLDGVVWIQSSGAGGTRVMRAAPDGSDQQVLIDLHGSHAHEYFPSVGPDGRWLVWGATAAGHEHDRADYEIFLWEIGTEAETTLRLTYHTGNDMWPDVWVRTD